MKIIAFVTLLSLTCSFSFSQQLKSKATDGYLTESPLSYIYKLSDENVIEIFESKSYRLEPKDEWFHTLVDTFSEKFNPTHLTPGHYLTIKADKEHLQAVLMVPNQIPDSILKFTENISEKK